MWDIFHGVPQIRGPAKRKVDDLKIPFRGKAVEAGRQEYVFPSLRDGIQELQLKSPTEGGKEGESTILFSSGKHDATCDVHGGGLRQNEHQSSGVRERDRRKN